MNGIQEQKKLEFVPNVKVHGGIEKRKPEVWKDIFGWEGIYQISNHGRLKSFKKDPNGYILSNKNKNGWYFTVNLQAKERERISTKIHVLVAKHFIPNPLNLPEVNHKNFDKQNNYYKNLEWVTTKQNNHHAIENGVADFKSMNYYNQVIKPKTVIQFDFDGNYIAEFINCKEAAKETGVCHRNIHQVAAKTEYKPGLTRKQAGGFIWEFKND